MEHWDGFPLSDFGSGVEVDEDDDAEEEGSEDGEGDGEGALLGTIHI